MTNDLDPDIIFATKPVRIVRFVRSERNGKPWGHSDSLPVYVNRDYEGEVYPDETWICRLELNPHGGNYFAVPIQKFDASFFADLRMDQIDSMAMELWKSNRPAVLPKLEELYRASLESGIKEDYAAQIALKDEEIASLKKTLAETEKKSRENERIIRSLSAQADAARYPAPAGGSAQLSPDGIPVPGAAADVERTGPDSIRSEMFDRPRYFAHISGDRRMLLLRPDPNGPVVCTDGEISLYGLNMLSPMHPDSRHVAEYSPRYGGIAVYL